MEHGAIAVRAWLQECAATFAEHASELNELDWILGDGDHGTNMLRGFSFAQALEVDRELDARAALRKVGMTLVSNVGGASGPLFGTFFLRMGASWPQHPTTASVENALRNGIAAVMARGKAKPGDKTMLDALIPAADRLAEEARLGSDLATALERAVESAEAGRDATAGMQAQRGRAYLKSAGSVGVLDPGAVSMALILRTAIKHVGSSSTD